MVKIKGSGQGEGLNGLASSDIIYAYAGNDTVFSGSGHDVVMGGDGLDRIDAGSGNDSLYGETGNDTLLGGQGNDVFQELGNNGSDLLAGGIGWDTVSYRDGISYRPILFLPFSGRVQRGASVDRLIEIESVTATASSQDRVTASNSQANLDIDLTRGRIIGEKAWQVRDFEHVIGGIGHDQLRGNAAANRLVGGSGNDTLNGMGGADTLVGGSGNDSYYRDHANDVVVEGQSQGVDTLYSSLNETLPTAIEHLVLLGSAASWGVGNAKDNRMIGNHANNTLDGMAGNDTLIGGLGDDVYYVDTMDDHVLEADNAGTDRIYASNSYTLPAGAEQLYLTGNALVANGNSLGNLLVGNDLDNTLNGAAGADTMRGGKGNDYYVVDNPNDSVEENLEEGIDTIDTTINFILPMHVENLRLLENTSALNGIGNTLDNIILGNSSANTLNGGLGSDTMAGGNGDDHYYVDDVQDIVIEYTNEGYDTVFSSVDYALPQQVEAAVLIGADNISLWGGSAGEKLTGNQGNNRLYGNDGNDTLNGSAGNDTLYGGAGLDLYYFVNDFGQDSVLDTDTTEQAFHFETDLPLTINLVSRMATDGTNSVHWNGGYAIRVVAGNGNDHIHGSAEDNVLYGSGGNDTLLGLNGNDTLYGQAGNDLLIGGTGDDFLFAAQGGEDTLQGGSGDDFYQLSESNLVSVAVLQDLSGLDTLHFNNFGNNSLQSFTALDSNADGGLDTLRLTLYNGSTIDIRNCFDNSTSDPDDLQAGPGFIETFFWPASDNLAITVTIGWIQSLL